MKHRFSDFTQVVFCVGRMARNVFSGLLDHLNHHFIDFAKVAFFDIQKVENEFSGPFDHLIDRFFDLVQVAFFGAQKAYRPPEKSLYRLNASRIFGQPEIRY
jgi:hypothetical protein